MIDRRNFLAVVAMSGLTACAGDISRNPGDPSDIVSFEPSKYLLGIGDKITVNIFEEATLSGEYEVDSSGNVMLPIIGSVKAEKRTVESVKSDIVKAYAKSSILKDPKINVVISTYRPIFVLGEVKNSGQYPFRPGMNVVEAVATAGGWSYRGNQRTVYIFRRRLGREFEYSLSGAPVLLEPGDTIRIPERFI